MKKCIFILILIVYFSTQVFAMSKRNNGFKGMENVEYLGKQTCTIAEVGVFQYDFFSTKEKDLMSIFNAVCAKYNKKLTHSSIISTHPDDAFIPQEVIDMMKRKKANVSATYMGGAIMINIDAGDGVYNSYKLQSLK